MKTAYIPKNETAQNILKNAHLFEPIQIADKGEQLYRKVYIKNPELEDWTFRYGTGLGTNYYRLEPVSVEYSKKEVLWNNK